MSQSICIFCSLLASNEIHRIAINQSFTWSAESDWGLRKSLVLICFCLCAEKSTKTNQLVLSTIVLIIILIDSQGLLLIGGLGSTSTTELVTGGMMRTSPLNEERCVLTINIEEKFGFDLLLPDNAHAMYYCTCSL